MWFSILMALGAGAAIALQASLNARLGMLLDSALAATVVAFAVAFVSSAAMMLSYAGADIRSDMVTSVPAYLWVAGGVISAMGVGISYYLIPKMGMGSMMSLVLSGQIMTAAAIGHWRWFGLPENPLTFERCAGLVLMIAGILLFNRGAKYGS